MHPFAGKSLCLLVTGIALAGTAIADDTPEVGLKPVRGFVTADDALVLAKSAGDGLLLPQAALAPGLYAFSGEYRTEGIGRGGKFAIDAKTRDWKDSLSGYQSHPPAASWVPTRLYFRVRTAGDVQIRLGNLRGAEPRAKVFLRNASVKPFAMPAGTNWLVNGDWAAGTPGELPSPWEWRAKGDVPPACGLIPNASFRTGKHVLRLAGDGRTGPVLYGPAMPLPASGEIELTVWARAAGEGDTSLTLHVVRSDWGSRVEKRVKPLESWRKFSARWKVDAGGKPWFFVRLDTAADGAPVEVADVRVVWHGDPASDPAARAAAAAAETPAQRFARLGFQGVPGANLLYNPDMELGGVGFYYDYSWPKKTSDYAAIRATRPVEFVEGLGVDGGTCAHIRNGTIRAYCFPVTRGKTYTVSADFRAPKGVDNADCLILSFDPEWQAALWTKAENIPADRWRRYHWTFEWKKRNVQSRGYVRFGSTTGVLVDRIQVVEGKQAAYQAPPVMLGLVFERWPYFVRGRDEPVCRLKIVPAPGRTGTAKVEAVSRDAWGRTAWKRTLDAALDAPTVLPLKLPADRLGVFHVSLRATVDGQVAGIGINRYAILDPPTLQRTGATQPGLFGICQESFNFPVWLCEDHARIHTDLGVRLNRFFASIPPDLPRPIPAAFFDDLLAKCKPFRDAGIDVLPCIEPEPASVRPIRGTTAMPTDEQLRDFGAFVREYVGGLANQVRLWEIFNEANLWRVRSGPNAGERTMPPAKYLAFQKVAHEAIKAVDPDLQVYGGGLNNVPAEWIERWMSLGAGRFMDAMSFHPYGWTNFYPRAMELRAQMERHGFDGPLVNSEKYFGCNIFHDRAGYEETRRGYYLPPENAGELRTAGRSIRHFVSHVAAGMPCCPFNPIGTLFRRGPAGELFLYDFFGAYNAATRFLVPAGRGRMLDLGPSLTAFVFPEADAGPLLVLWTPLPEVEASMRGLPDDYAAYDFMGNRLTAEAATEGVRIANDPSYVRCPAGTTVEAIAAALGKADVIGLGDPFQVGVALTGPKRLTVTVTSCRTGTLDGTVTLSELPSGWKPVRAAAAFRGLAAGKTVRVPFDFEAIDARSLGRYTVKAVVDSGEEFVARRAVLRPLFVGRSDKVRADGELGEWNDASWLALGDDALSKDFNPDLPRNGAADLSARMAMAWSPEAFAVAVEVTDDKHAPKPSPRLGWGGDSVQVYFDQENDATPDAAAAGDDVEYIVSLSGGRAHAWLAKGAEGNYKGEANKTDGFHDADVKLAVVRRGSKTIYEMVFPRRDCLPDTSLEAGGNFGFSLLINDSDGEGRKIGLTLAPKGGEPYNRPHEYRDVVLR